MQEVTRAQTAPVFQQSAPVRQSLVFQPLPWYPESTEQDNIHFIKTVLRTCIIRIKFKVMLEIINEYCKLI